MTRIIIDDVHSLADLLHALAAVQSAFASGRADFDSLQECFSQSPDPGERVPRALHPRAGQVMQLAPDLVLPKPLVACPERGTHTSLIECWACWSDVQRKACFEVDVLSPAAWDLALAELTGHACRDRAPLPLAPPVVDEEA